MAINDHRRLGFSFRREKETRGEFSKATQRNEFSAFDLAKLELILLTTIHESKGRRVRVLAEGRHLGGRDFKFVGGGKFWHGGED